MDDCKASAKKSLMNSLETFDNRAKSLSDLAEMSNRLVRKFTNPRPQPEGEQLCEKSGEIRNSQPDLIDLFNITAERMQKEINIIGSNIERLLAMVD